MSRAADFDAVDQEEPLSSAAAGASKQHAIARAKSGSRNRSENIGMERSYSFTGCSASVLRGRPF
jgi:hypothetical protein